MSTSFWVCAAVTGISAYVSLGYSVAGAVSAAGQTRLPYLYTLARSLALALAATVVLFTHTPSWLKALAVAMIIVQGADAAIGFTIRDRLKTVGPAATALANLGTLLWFVS